MLLVKKVKTKSWSHSQGSAEETPRYNIGIRKDCKPGNSSQMITHKVTDNEPQQNVKNQDRQVKNHNSNANKHPEAEVKGKFEK